MTANFENQKRIEHELAQRALRVSGLPYFYQIQLNKHCNQKCIMCMPDGAHPHDEMPLENFQAFLEDIKYSARHLTLIGGEPLMYRWIDQVLDLLSEIPLAVTVITNATALTESVSRQLLSLQEIELRCSIDAASRAMYRKIHGADQFDRVAFQIRRFSELAHHSAHARLIMHYVVMRENLAEISAFVDFAATFNPHRIEFHPVRHVSHWAVSNETGWMFRGGEQCCESFRDKYNEAINEAKSKCATQGISCEVVLL